MRFKKEINPNHCPYCKGKGYFQLRLGGSETCSCCNGSGKKRL
ncbi:MULTISPECIES: YuiA family protein [unclassified Psychrobacillus]